MLAISFSAMAMHQEFTKSKAINILWPDKEKLTNGMNLFKASKRSSVFGENPDADLDYIKKYRGFEEITRDRFDELWASIISSLRNLIGKDMSKVEFKGNDELILNFFLQIITGSRLEEYNAYVESIVVQFRENDRIYCNQYFNCDYTVAILKRHFALDNDQDVVDLMVMVRNSPIVEYFLSKKRLNELSKYVIRFVSIFGEINNTPIFNELRDEYDKFLAEKKAKIRANVELALKDADFMKDLETQLKSSESVESTQLSILIPSEALADVSTSPVVQEGISRESESKAKTKPKAKEFGGFKKGFFKEF